jgi:membrane protein required for colicin V production
MSLLDILIIIILAVGMFLGFMRGLLRQIVGLISLYLTVLLAGFMYPLLGQGIQVLGPNMSTTATEAIAFALLMLLGYTTLNFSIYSSYKETKLPIPGVLNQIGGMMLGFFLTCLWIGLGLIVINFVAGGKPWLAYDGVRQFLASMLHGSAMLRIFTIFLSVAFITLEPWFYFFGGLPPIFDRFIHPGG